MFIYEMLRGLWLKYSQKLIIGPWLEIPGARVFSPSLHRRIPCSEIEHERDPWSSLPHSSSIIPPFYLYAFIAILVHSRHSILS